MSSSSGGAFTAISDFFLENGNAVVAAIYNYENHMTEFQMILDEKQRERAKGSKYMQSKPGDIYREAYHWMMENPEKELLFACLLYTSAYFDYKLGTLEYRSVRFETEILDKPNFQGNAAVNYTDRETPWTRIIEHKWFEFGKDENGDDLPKTIISREYSREWKPGDEPYYPVNDAKNGLLYSCLLYTSYGKLSDS